MLPRGSCFLNMNFNDSEPLLNITFYLVFTVIYLNASIFLYRSDVVFQNHSTILVTMFKVGHA